MKKLALYSDQIRPLSDDIDRALKTLLQKAGPKIGYISSASDPERTYFTERTTYYTQIGMDMTVYVELDKTWQPERVNELLECDAIHLSGGNTYYFLYWLRKRNMIETLLRYVDRGGVLIGVSAGSILMTPDISTSALCGDRETEGLTDFSGMNLVDFSFVPHFGEVPVTEDDLKKYSRDTKTRVYAARDSGGIIVDGSDITCIGDVIVIEEE